jgi:RNA polymerase sigma-19 factor, ECF subfamily
MPDRRRQVYELSRREGLSIAQIADRLGLSPNTVRNTLGHALAFIRERLENSGYILPALILTWIL